MLLRLARLRFLILRCCIYSILILLLLQILSYFHQRTPRSDPLESSEGKFWQKTSSEDQSLTDTRRIERIKLIEEQTLSNGHNWTSILLENYRKKLLMLNQRDAQSNWKDRFAENSLNKSQQEVFEIHEETLVFQQPKFCSSTRIFHPQCPYSNCQWKCNVSSVNSKNLYRAHVFHHVDIRSNEMQAKLNHRTSNDIWILWIDEANRDIRHLNSYQFNWTISFRQDSEISIGTYGILIPRAKKMNLSYNTSEFLQFLADANIQTDDLSLEYRIFLNYRLRRRQALWFISNCVPQRRLKYYRQLKSHYPIQTFGKCVNNQCRRDHACEVEQSYLAMFYLAFESQTCMDYITEKFWRALSYGMIPIVLGPKKQSYVDLGIPESAFIHVEQFRSAAALAGHLQRIGNDYNLYREYFQWLKTYEIFYDIGELEPIRMCELCMRLNMQKSTEGDQRFYRDIHQWHQVGC